MMPADDRPETRPAYALRFTRRALSDVDATHAWFLELAGEDVADTWKDGLFDAVAGLALMPHLQVVPEAKRFRREVRQLLYRRAGSDVAPHVLFVVQEDSPDGPQVIIVALRHGARKPITRAEAQEIEQDI